MKFKNILIISFLITAGAFAQSNSTISGIVTDKKNGEPLPGVNVFISGTFNGTITDIDGKFELKNISTDGQTLVISMVGYEKIYQPITRNVRQETLKLRLEEKTYELDNINIVTDESDWKYYYSIFKDEFIGKRKYGDECEILNPYSIDFYYNPDTDILTAECDSIIILKNYALGYQIDILLEQFKFDISTTPSSGSYDFYFSFDELLPKNENQLEEWQDNRAEAYFASPNCFFKNLLNHTISDDDYEYDCIPYYIDSTYFIDSTTSKFYYEISDERYTNVNLNHIRNEFDPVFNYYFIDATFDLTVNPLVAKWSGFTEIDFINGELFLNKSGRVLNHNMVEYNGYWAKFRVSDALPDEYEPPTSKE